MFSSAPLLRLFPGAGPPQSQRGPRGLAPPAVHHHSSYPGPPHGRLTSTPGGKPGVPMSGWLPPGHCPPQSDVHGWLPPRALQSDVPAGAGPLYLPPPQKIMGPQDCPVWELFYTGGSGWVGKAGWIRGT